MAGLAYPSTLILVGINLIPLVLIWTGRWHGYDLLLAYWWEGLVVAAMALIKKAVARARMPSSAEATFNLYDLPIAVYIGVSLAASVLYILVISSLALVYDGNVQSLDDILNPTLNDLVAWVRREAFGTGLIFYAAVQAVPYIYSFVSDYLRRAEYRYVKELFDSALIRITAIELTALVLVIASISTEWFPLWLVVVIKMMVDGLLHLIERINANPSAHPPISDQPGV